MQPGLVPTAQLAWHGEKSCLFFSPLRHGDSSAWSFPAPTCSCMAGPSAAACSSCGRAASQSSGPVRLITRASRREAFERMAQLDEPAGGSGNGGGEPGGHGKSGGHAH